LPGAWTAAKCSWNSSTAQRTESLPFQTKSPKLFSSRRYDRRSAREPT
jgi:hypothetical protein